jgi:hypothetical protein
MELVINAQVAINNDRGKVVVAYIDDILIATMGSLENHHKQVSRVFQLLMDNHVCIEIEKYIFNAKEVPFLGFLVSGSGLWMDPDKAIAIVTWLRPTKKKEVQRLLGVWN